MKISKGKIAVFLSGRGSNFESIYKNSIKKNSNYKIVVVISDKKNAKGLFRAKDLGLNAYYVSKRALGSKKKYERGIVEILDKFHVELICLAGYMKIVGEVILERYKGRIINIHPSLLPSFQGLDAQKKALEYGVKVTGCTVHFVDQGVDTGPIILQKEVLIREDDNEESLSMRILKEEHIIYPKAIELYFNNSLKTNGRRIKVNHD